MPTSYEHKQDDYKSIIQQEQLHLNVILGNWGIETVDALGIRVKKCKNVLDKLIINVLLHGKIQLEVKPRTFIRKKIKKMYHGVVCRIHCNINVFYKKNEWHCLNGLSLSSAKRQLALEERIWSCIVLKKKKIAAQMLCIFPAQVCYNYNSW